MRAYEDANEAVAKICKRRPVVVLAFSSERSLAHSELASAHFIVESAGLTLSFEKLADPHLCITDLGSLAAVVTSSTVLGRQKNASPIPGKRTTSSGSSPQGDKRTWYYQTYYALEPALLHSSPARCLDITPGAMPWSQP